jgi:hypothetical protein
MMKKKSKSKSKSVSSKSSGLSYTVKSKSVSVSKKKCKSTGKNANNKDYICNPVSGRWVKKSGAAGKKLMMKKKSKYR